VPSGQSSSTPFGPLPASDFASFSASSSGGKPSFGFGGADGIAAVLGTPAASSVGQQGGFERAAALAVPSGQKVPLSLQDLVADLVLSDFDSSFFDFCDGDEDIVTSVPFSLVSRPSPMLSPPLHFCVRFFCCCLFSSLTYVMNRIRTNLF
jgi:hypothetical protein